MNAPPEKLGSFYLGSEYNIEKQEITGEHINYDARDLTTHAVCIGMTGSGKTGLCICLLEEAAIDKVPAIIIDPKGDITNHLLHFPELQPEDFLEWINIDDARRKNLSKEEYAKQVSQTWKKGLEDWGINKERIENLAKSVDFTIYTPGSSTGIPINILSSLEVPKITDRETLNNLITGTVRALLELLKISSDPIRDKEGILLSAILQHYWSLGESLSLEKLIQAVQNPPFNRLGVFDLDTFYSSDKRLDLALAINSLIASPSFTEWLTGDPLDISKLLYTEDGKPRHSIFSLSHLSDEERMFFVTLILERISSWIQQQSGTTSLRGIIYFDELFGYMPPVANPPSKTPLLRLLKQGRAYGLGVVLTTQNPVDLDYKGLTNTGTWFIGKLQTDRDKNRVLEGLEGVSPLSSISNEIDYGKIIGALGSRVFLLHNVHDNAPKIFHTRWAMNYLRGPLLGGQIKKLMLGKKDQITTRKSITKKDFVATPPTIDPSIEQFYIDGNNLVYINKPASIPGKIQLVPTLLLKYSVRFFDKKRDIDKIEKHWAITPEPNNLGEIDWSQIETLDSRLIYDKPIYSEENLVYHEIPDSYNTKKELRDYRDKLSEFLYRNKSYSISTHPSLKISQEQEESKAGFLMRVKQAAREERDQEIDKLEKKYDTKLDSINSKINKLTSSLSSEEAEYDARKREEIFGIGETVLGVLLGRRRTTGITTASRRRRMTTQTKHKIEETSKEIEELKKEMSELEQELEEQVQEITDKWDNVEDKIEEYKINPRRTDIDVDEPKLAWIYFK
jgi:hypothetical protein